MRYLAVACDYDGTLATAGWVAPSTVAAVARLKASGRRAILVTGRELEDLLSVFPHAHLFDRLVAENGALLYEPASRRTTVLGQVPPDRLVQELQERGIAPLSVGRVIVATRQPHETAALEVIRELGLEWQLVFNKGAVMLLPPGVNKASGLHAALAELGLSAHNVVGIGDAENDHAFLRFCECSAAVANALPIVKQSVDLVLKEPNGAGVERLLDQLIHDDLRSVEPSLARRRLLLGTSGGRSVTIPPYGANLLLAGVSGSGKSTLAAGLLERLADQAYRYCVIDPEGDYEAFPEAVTFGDRKHPPNTDEVLQLFTHTTGHAIVNLLAVPLEDRPRWFGAFLPSLQEVRARTGSPHWIVVDEAHHVLPSSWRGEPLQLPVRWQGVAIITVQPSALALEALRAMDVLIAFGEGARGTVADVQAALQEPQRVMALPKPAFGEAILWSRRPPVKPILLRIEPTRAERRRHRRKYAEGDLGERRSFYFTGPAGALNLRASNLMVFNQLADGVDDETWLHHLRRGHYSRWLRESIKDDALADRVAELEAASGLSPRESRRLIREAIEHLYTLPAAVASGQRPAP